MEFQVTSPVNGEVCASYQFLSWSEVDKLLDQAKKAQKAWAETPLEERLELLSRWVDLLETKKEFLATELTLQMGRPCCEAPEEFEQFTRRAKRVLELAPEAQRRSEVQSKGSLKRYTCSEPLVWSWWRLAGTTLTSSVLTLWCRP